MSLGSSSPSQKRAMDFEFPSPKRARLDPFSTEPLQSTLDTSNPGTPFDDGDDLYGTPSEPTQQTGLELPSESKRTDSTQVSGSKKSFLLPGLGEIGSKLQESTAALSIDTIRATETVNDSEPSLGSLHNIPAGHGIQGGADIADPANHQRSTLLLPAQGEEIAIGHPDSGIDADVMRNPADPQSIAVSTSGEIPIDSTVVSATENTTDPVPQSDSHARNLNIDVAVLSEEVPVSATVNGDVEESASVMRFKPNKNAEIEEKASSFVDIDPNVGSAIVALDQVGRDKPTLENPKNSNNGNEKTVEADEANELAEFEIDSSPINSSSSDSSSDSSSSDDSDDYEMLSPEEQARRLMQEDIGSEDEGPGKNRNGISAGPLRTENEKPDEIVPKPDLLVTPEMKILELGDVDVLVENQALIKANTTGEFQVLETGSVLCLEDRSVIGVVAETLGRVQQPYYSVRFTNAAAITEAGVSKGTRIYYVESHSTTVFTEPLKAYKGSDASNLHDEEIGDDEMEFSDDEKEAEHKKRLKQARQARRNGRPADGDGFARGPGWGSDKLGRQGGRGGRFNGEPRDFDTRTIVNYDDAEVDGPYNPLARPTNLHEMMGRDEPPIENQLNVNYPQGDGRGGRSSGERGRGRGRGRGRSDRGRGHRDRRGGQRNHEDQRAPNNGNAVVPSWNSTSEAQYPPPYGLHQQHDMYVPAQSPTQSPYASNPHAMQPQLGNNLFNYVNNSQQSPISQPYQNFNHQSPQSNIPPGAFVNPAFFAQGLQGNQYSAGNNFRQN